MIKITKKEIRELADNLLSIYPGIEQSLTGSEKIMIQYRDYSCELEFKWKVKDSRVFIHELTLTPIKKIVDEQYEI